ncbi:beta-L-arabinofuranosidase domain-containing protein [Bacillus sp. JJ1503]|uniref:glycoside hydrolase family 127 protein n=1 Tax=unclassified Bacillus (in: firmicutes) TaxID=185979 RepID=UPI002FFE9058
MKIQDSFWSKYQELIHNVVIPFQWEVMNDTHPDTEPTHTIQNFRIAAGEDEGEFHGMRFQDSDLAKWLETVGHTLAHMQNRDLEELADEAIKLIGRAQQPDGYLNTYFTVARPGKRWTNLHNDHELYCAGHMIEAAVAYYHATGKSELIDIVCKYVDHISTVIGPEVEKIRGYDAHPEIELALVKLYRVTKNPQHLQLSKFFVEERGAQKPHFFDVEANNYPENFVRHREKDYSQAHIPIREQVTAEGHAVRAMYLYSAMADLAKEYDDQELYSICKKIWNNVVTKRMYVTGGIGSQANGERFTIDYDLPNDRSYTETCAAIGFVFWARRMLEISPEREYADSMERALYNGVLSGMSQDGKKYFYVNPLEVWPEACEFRHDLRHVKNTRQPWFGCACCPPNISRLVASLGEYIYTQNEDELFVHLYTGNKLNFQVGIETIQLAQVTNYPWEDTVQAHIQLNNDTVFTLALRLPEWCENPQIFVNQVRINLSGCIENGYAKIKRTWKDQDQVTLILPMTIQKVRAHPHVRENIGKVVLQRGPIVYCLEEVDNGKNLPIITLSKNSDLIIDFDDGVLKGVPIIKGNAYRYDSSHWTNKLYQSTAAIKDDVIPINIIAVPYYLWNNRGPGEMITWIHAN